MSEISVLVEGGKASAGAPLGPALGPMGVDIGKVVAEINNKTKEFAGMKVPVKVVINSDKSFEVLVGSPPVSALIKKELGLSKAAKNPKEEKVGNLTMQQLIKIAKMKIDNLTSTNLKKASNEVAGTANSMGVTIENKKPTQIIKDINAGKFDELFKE